MGVLQKAVFVNEAVRGVAPSALCASVDVTTPSLHIRQKVMKLCERMDLVFQLRDGAMVVLLPPCSRAREELYEALDHCGAEYTLPLFGD